MNDFTNETTSIRELQRYLYYISLVMPKIPKVVPDGIYGPLTRQAVEAYQAEAGLPVTGIVDKLTWDSIAAKYTQITDASTPPLPLAIFPSSRYIVKIGERSDVVSVIQILLRCLASEYDYKVLITVSGMYSDRDSRAVKVIQSVHSLPQTGNVDVLTWNAISTDYGLFCCLSE